MKRFAGFSVAVLALTVVASAAAGGSTIVNAYAGKAGGTVGSVLTNKHPVTHPSIAKTVHTGSTLPFTGLSLAGIALVALVLVALGFALTRISRNTAA